MGKKEFLDALERIKGIVKQFPDGLEIIVIDARVEFPSIGEFPALHVWEPQDIKPDRFYELADRVGAVEVYHTDMQNGSVKLSFLFNGIGVFCIIEKEVLDDDADAD